MTIKTTLILTAFVSFGFASCQTKPAANAPKPGSTTGSAIDSVTARRYVKNYEKHAGTVDDSIITVATGKTVENKKPNTRCVWFSEEQLEDLVARIKAEKGDGIRFYLATYDKKLGAGSSAAAQTNPLFGYNTLVMVSTKAKVITPDSTQHWDYYKNGTANSPGEGFIIGTTPENRGEMCPPPSNCPSIGARLIQ